MKLSNYLAGCLGAVFISILWWLSGWDFNTRNATAVTWFISSVFAFVWIAYLSKLLREISEIIK